MPAIGYSDPCKLSLRPLMTIAIPGGLGAWVPLPLLKLVLKMATMPHHVSQIVDPHPQITEKVSAGDIDEHQMGIVMIQGFTKPISMLQHQL